jgi:hypothetical protein
VAIVVLEDEVLSSSQKQPKQLSTEGSARGTGTWIAGAGSLPDHDVTDDITFVYEDLH